MLKAIKLGYKPKRGGHQVDEESLEDLEEVQIESDTDLDTPPAAAAKAKLGEVLKTIQSPPSPPRSQPFAAPRTSEEHPEYGMAWKVLINVMIVIPWTLVLLLSLIVNKWQLLFRPLGSIFWSTIDYLDQRMPVAVEWLLWGINQISLTLHIVTVGINLGVMWIMWDNGHHASPIFMVVFYGLCHYCSAVTMFKELDMRDAGDTYFSDVVTLFQRMLDVLFFDIQMAASVVHSNRMLEGMTQVMFKGFEEARVALTTLMFTIPCCIIVGVEYGVFMKGQLVTNVRDLNVLTSYSDQLYAALCFTVINSIEKVLRLSVVDPWMHDKGDGFPLLYIRSHAARLPGSFVRDFLVRCKVALAGSQGRLVLKELYSHYTQQVKDTSVSLSDPHKAYLLRKAMHFFNTRLKYRPNIDNYPTSKPVMQELIADDICPGIQLSSMLADILLEASGLTTLTLANNHMDDMAIAGVMQALAGNDEVQLRHLDLSGNQILARGTAAVAAVLQSNQTISSLSLAHCPVRDDGARALAEALKTNIALYRLDLSHCQIGPEGALALAAALKTNPVLFYLNLSGTDIGNTGVEAVCKALRSAGSSGLKELDLSRTTIDDKGAAAVAGLLSVSRCLEKLELADTHITDAGAQLLCSALQNNTTLQSINVSDSSCMDKSWQKLLSHVVKGKAKA